MANTSPEKQSQELNLITKSRVLTTVETSDVPSLAVTDSGPGRRRTTHTFDAPAGSSATVNRRCATLESKHVWFGLSAVNIRGQQNNTLFGGFYPTSRHGNSIHH